MATSEQHQAVGRDSEADLHAVFNATTESIFLVAPDHTLLDLNQVAAQRMGRSQEELIGHTLYNLLPPKVGAHRRPFIERAFSTGESISFEDERSGRWMENSLYPVRDAEGKVVRLAIFSRDITARRRMD